MKITHQSFSSANRKIILSALIVFLFMFSFPAFSADHNPPHSPVLVLIRPAKTQIRNLEVLFEKQLINLKNVRVMAVFHEDEVTDYQEAFDYAARKKIPWISYHPVKGGVDLKNIFHSPNNWTSQFREIFNRSDGIIFTGGMDIPPRFYAQKTLLTTEPATPVRSAYELSFLYHLVSRNPESKEPALLSRRPDYPVLAICLGCQSLNVACGGDLIQDIPSQVYGLKTFEDVLAQPRDRIHSARYFNGLNAHLHEELPPAFHRIRTEKDIFPGFTLRPDALPEVLTSHHQAIGKLGKNLIPLGWSMDKKIIEIIRHRVFPSVLGVQFHPEYHGLFEKDLFFFFPDCKKDEHEFSTGKPTENQKSWLNQGRISKTRNFNMLVFLKNNPPSLGFHRQIWSWFSRCMKKSFANRKNHKE